jgi:hypothetical protein
MVSPLLKKPGHNVAVPLGVRGAAHDGDGSAGSKNLEDVLVPGEGRGRHRELIG